MIESHLICCSSVMQTTGEYVSAISHYPNGAEMYNIWSSVWQCAHCGRKAAKPEEWRKIVSHRAGPRAEAAPVNRVAAATRRNGRYTNGEYRRRT